LLGFLRKLDILERVEQGKQHLLRKPRETSQKEQLLKPPKGWQYLSPTPAYRKVLTDGQRQSTRGRVSVIITTIALVVALVDMSRFGYFSGWLSFVQDIWLPYIVGIVIALASVVTLSVLSYRKKRMGCGDKTLWDWIQLLTSIRT